MKFTELLEDPDVQRAFTTILFGLVAAIVDDDEDTSEETEEKEEGR